MTTATPHQLERLKELLALQLERLTVLQKSKLWASAQVLERKIQSTRNAISLAEKELAK
jgi:hypothetical protein